MKKITKKSFKEATKLKNIWNTIVEWEGYTLATVMWHENRQWKVIPKDVDFDTISFREYKPIAQFHTQEELWGYLKKELLK